MDLYYTAGSSPCRLVLLVAAALDIQLNLKEVDLRGGGHLTPEFLQLNPQHTVPTLVDDDFSIWESRAISRYLINKYDNKKLYPEDIKTRTPHNTGNDPNLSDKDVRQLIPQTGPRVLFTRCWRIWKAEFTQPNELTISYPQVFAGKPADEELFHKLEEGLDFFNTFLKGHKYAVGESLTLADLSLVATISTIDAAGVSLEPYPRVEKWFELVKTTAPGYEEANEKGIKNFRTLVAGMKAKTEL